jgi:hypothetical protein
MTSAKVKWRRAASIASERNEIVDVLAGWTGTSRHVLHEPWVPPFIRDGFHDLILELEEAAPDGLDKKRTEFRRTGRVDKGTRQFLELSVQQRLAQGFHQLLNERFRLLVGAQLLRAGVITRVRKDTPDFDCRWGGSEFGVDVTTRALQEVGAALGEALERGLWDGPDVNITLMRSGELLFSSKPAVIAGISDRLIAVISERITGAPGEARYGSVPVPELGLTALWDADTGAGIPGARVTYESVLRFTDEEWDYHWAMAARQIEDAIAKRGCKNYALPTIVVVDVSRLGEIGRLLSVDNIRKLQDVLDNCDLGGLRGALVVRSASPSRIIDPLCWRGDESVLSHVGSVIFGQYSMPMLAS